MLFFSSSKMIDSTAIWDHQDVKELLSKRSFGKKKLLSLWRRGGGGEQQLEPTLCLRVCLQLQVAALGPHLAQTTSRINSCPAKRWERNKVPHPGLTLEPKQQARERQTTTQLKLSNRGPIAAHDSYCLTLHTISIQLDSTHIKVRHSVLYWWLKESIRLPWMD